MWKITLSCNVLVLTLLWLLSLVAITPAYNHLVQYAETNQALPILTDFAIRVRHLAIVIPLSWAVFTLASAKRMQCQTDASRGEYLMLHISVTLGVGLAMLLFFSLAGILPGLKFGAGIQ
jgi:hypothetical protein